MDGNKGKGTPRVGPRTPLETKKRIPKALRDMYIAQGLIFAFFFLVISLTLVLAVKLSLRVKDGPSEVTYKFFVTENGVETELSKRKYTLSDVRKNGVYYVSLDDISELLSLRYIGNYDEITLSGTDGGEYVTFTKASQNCLINGILFKMSASAYVNENEVYVPIDIFEQYYPGLSVSLDEEKMIYSLAFDKDSSSKAFTVKSICAIDGLFQNSEQAEDRLSGVSVTELSFVSDLSGHEQYMNPYDCYQYLVLVNRSHALAPSNIPSNLCKVRDSNIPITVKLRLDAQMSLEAMLKEARANGIMTLTVTNAYKSYGTINTEFYAEVTKKMNSDRSLSKADAEAAVSEYKTRAGYDEYQTGLSCTVLNYGKNAEDFKQSAEFAWLKENAWKFGYILRYPEGKEEITGYDYSAVRYRYVGRYHAEKITNLGMCLEEYVEYVDALA